MPCWYFDKKELRNTPSLADSIDYETECRYRKEGARFIIDTGAKMDLGYNTMATGVVYFHRFYIYHSFKNFPRYVTACCCLLLAGKVEETPKKCKDIIRIARTLLSEEDFASFGDDPKEEVMTMERILLQTIKFDLQVEHPYQYLLKYAKCLKGDKTKLHKMVQMAWTFVNDSLCTTLCLQWEPEIIAVALMYLAGKLSKFEVVDWTGRTSKHLRWWDMFIEEVTMDLLEDICHQVLDLYSQSNPSTPSSPPQGPKSKEPPGPIAPTPNAGALNKHLKADPKQLIPVAGEPIPVVDSSKPIHVVPPVVVPPPPPPVDPAFAFPPAFPPAPPPLAPAIYPHPHAPPGFPPAAPPFYPPDPGAPPPFYPPNA